MADSPAFAWTCAEIVRTTSLSELVARGTVRLALKQAGLAPDSVSGEEMAVVLRDTRIVDAQTVTERMLKAVRGLAFEHAGKSFGVTVSAGVAQFQPGETQLQWIARADRALYAAKAAGRDRVCAAPAGEPETKPATEAGAAPA